MLFYRQISEFQKSDKMMKKKNQQHLGIGNILKIQPINVTYVN